MARSTTKANPGRGKHCYLRGSTWWFDFKLQGEPNRRRGPLHGCVSKDEAEIAAGVLYKTATQVALGVIDPAQVLEKVTLAYVIARFWEIEASTYLKPLTARGYGDRWIEFFGTTKLVNEITRADIVRYIERRKKGGYNVTIKGKPRVARPVADGTIRLEIEHLKRVIRKTGRDWSYAVPSLNQLDFSELDLGGQQVRHVEPWTVEQVEAFLRHVERYEAELYPLVLFTFCHPLRRNNVTNLLKSQVRWDLGDHGLIIVEVKSSRKKRKTLHIELTAESAAVIRSQWELHPTHVFSFVAKKNRPDLGHRRFQRYPFTQEGFRWKWEALREGLGLPKFRFHDVRHVIGTLINEVTGDLTKTRDGLGHSKLSTSEGYTNHHRKNARAGAEAVSAARAAARKGKTPPPVAAQIAELERQLAALKATQVPTAGNVVQLPRRQAS